MGIVDNVDNFVDNLWINWYYKNVKKSNFLYASLNHIIPGWYIASVKYFNSQLKNIP